MRLPQVSIIMPLYNAEKYVKQAIDSVLLQSFFDFELLIADDGSTDNSKRILEEYDDTRIKKFFFDINIGVVEITNFLFKKCNGNYIAIQDADDWCSEDKILKQVNILNEQNDIDLVGTSYCYTNQNGKIVQTFVNAMNHEDVINYINKNQYLPFASATVMFRKEILQHTGNLRDYFNRIGAGDFDWFYRLVFVAKVVVIGDVCYYYRNNPVSFTKTITTNPLKYFSEKIAFFLYQERLLTGTDSLETGNTKNIDTFVLPLLKEYKKDPSKIYREIFKNNLDKSNYKKALHSAFKAFKEKPFLIKNSTLFYTFVVKFFEVLKFKLVKKNE